MLDMDAYRLLTAYDIPITKDSATTLTLTCRKVFLRVFLTQAILTLPHMAHDYSSTMTAHLYYLHTSQKRPCIYHENCHIWMGLLHHDSLVFLANPLPRSASSSTFAELSTQLQVWEIEPEREAKVGLWLWRELQQRDSSDSEEISYFEPPGQVGKC